MDIQRQFPGVRWIGGGAISFVYEVHPSIVVKAPKRGEYERVQFRKELEIYEIFSQHPPSPFLVQSLFYSNNGIFLEYVNGMAPISRQQIRLLDCSTRYLPFLQNRESSYSRPSNYDSH